MKFVLALAMVLLMSGGAMATAEECFNAQGIVILPSISANYLSPSYNMYSEVTLSNITDKTVTCKVVIYDHDGNDVTSYGQVYSGAYGATSSTLVSTGTGEFTIPAKSTRVYFFGTVTSGNKFIYGHGEVKWKSTDTSLRKALIGAVYKFRFVGPSTATSSEVLINNGQPF